MQEKEFKLLVPKRLHAKATYINIKTFTLNKLGDRDIAFILPGGPGLPHNRCLPYLALQSKLDLVFHDPRATGKSDITTDCTMNNYIDDVEFIRHYLGLDKINVIGKSYGSICALGYALRYPQSIDRLVLAAGAPSYRLFDLAYANLLKLGSPLQIELGNKLWQGQINTDLELKQYFEEMASLYCLSCTTKEPVDVTGYSRYALNLGFTDFLRKFDYEDQLEQINIPTLILAGQKDWVNDVSQAKLMASKIKNSKLVIFENCGHAMEKDAKDKFFNAILDFI